MADQTLASLTAAAAATGGLIYGTQSGADRKFTLSAAGAAVAEATTAADQRTALACPGLAAANVFTVSGAASAPALSLTGSVFTGGSATTTKPLFLIEPSGTTSTGWNTNGSLFGINIPTSFSGDGLSIQKEGVKQLAITKDGRLSWGFQASFGRQPVLWAEGPYAQVEWLQGGDGNVSTQAPLLAGYYLSCVDPADGHGARFQKEPDSNLGILQNYYINAPIEVRIYGAYTDASNYERLSFITASGAYSIKPEAAGTGTLRELHISGLPTSNPGPGILWNNAGTPAIGT